MQTEDAVILQTAEKTCWIICITAILGYGFGQETGTETIRMLVVGFVLYVLPIIASWFVVWLETIKIILMGD